LIKLLIEVENQTLFKIKIINWFDFINKIEIVIEITNVCNKTMKKNDICHEINN